MHGLIETEFHRTVTGWKVHCAAVLTSHSWQTSHEFSASLTL